LEMKQVLVLCVVFCYLSSLVAGQAANGGICDGTVGSSKYSLKGLQGATGGKDITAQDQDGNTYFYRPCQVLEQELCQTIGDTKPAVCQKDTRKVAQYHDCGSTTQVSWAPRTTGTEKDGFVMSFNGGEEDRHSDIEFICDRNAGTGSMVALPEKPTHFYHLQWRTAQACPGKHGDGGDGKGDGDDGPAISGGWIFIIILLCLLFIYFVAGVAYNKFRKDAHGLELIPNHEFWFALPRLVWDGNMYTYRKLRGLCGASYEQV